MQTEVCTPVSMIFTPHTNPNEWSWHILREILPWVVKTSEDLLNYPKNT